MVVYASSSRNEIQDRQVAPLRRACGDRVRHQRAWLGFHRVGANLLPSDASIGASLGEVSIAGLPGEVQFTFQSIQAGGPFPYPKDGEVFGHVERHLPVRPRDYSHEYTVKTPRASSRRTKNRLRKSAALYR
ncbi:Guanyl-specific ribonuclease (EC 3.1.27.3) [Mycetohabitans rhizoxinica HKI 454]|uniref:Guanyl-specific ribonuclease n=1 Tax=Mycetohabitans rhizoxinica (strain DSM 19002 / CIP 109453 / HKI 454) TaxID=882378 RepID=E5AM27_MYCRK|nr:Guanyl-specific ribonuclease (EC 3.1.27.3) [Mycetohabitans rhizoxinica HKI 454]